MSVDLTALRAQEADPQPFRLGGTVRGSLGSSQRIDRLGDRWQLTFTTPPLRIEPDGRRWSVLLDQGSREGVIVRVRQPNLVNRALGSPVVASTTAAGRTLPISGLLPGSVVAMGQCFSIIVGGRRYLDKARTEVIAAADGTASLTLVNLLRVPVPSGTAVEFAQPKIEGTIDGEYGGAWGRNRLTSFSFTVVEDE